MGVEPTSDRANLPPAGFEVEAVSRREAERERGREPAAEILSGAKDLGLGEAGLDVGGSEWESNPPGTGQTCRPPVLKITPSFLMRCEIFPPYLICQWVTRTPV